NEAALARSRGVWIGVPSFDQSCARRAADPADQRGISSGWQRRENRRVSTAGFELKRAEPGKRRRQTRRVRRLAPSGVGEIEAVADQADLRRRERPSYIEVRERRPHGA